MSPDQWIAAGALMIALHLLRRLLLLWRRVLIPFRLITSSHSAAAARLAEICLEAHAGTTVSVLR